MNLETSILQSIRLDSSPAVLWRNQIGGYMRDGMFIKYGIGNPGGSDLIGFTPVGGRAIFTAIEVKTSVGIISDAQQNFIDVIRRAGGIAGVARSVSEAKDIILRGPR
jgi:hypothetical protein